MDRDPLAGIHLRALRIEDLDALHALASRPAVERGGIHAPHVSLDKRRKWFEGLTAQHCAIGAFAGETLVGWTELTPYKNRLAHMGGAAVNVHDAWQRSGIGSALTRAALDVADNWLGLRRIELICYADNEAAVALYRKHGFAVEAVQRGAVLRDGALVDAYMMARLKDAAPFQGDAPVSDPVAVPDFVHAEPAALAPRSATARLPLGDDAVTVRPTELADVDALTALRDVPHVQRNTLALPFSSRAWGEDFMRRNLERRSLNLCAVADGELIGHATLMSNEGRRAHSAVLGIGVHDAYAGRGIGTRLMRMLTESADHALGLRRIELTVFADNAPAIALYRRFGFVVEGRSRGSAMRDGELTDVLHMARLVDAPAFASLARGGVQEKE